jgi:acyl-coenzyme A thioesterase PaaI-like protein
MHTDHRVERQRLRMALERTFDVFVDRSATAAELGTWAGVMEEFAEGLEGRTPESVLWGIGDRGFLAVQAILKPPDYIPPAPQPGDRVRASVTFGSEQEGHRGLVHGGSIAQAFDHVVGMFDTFATGTLFTAELNVRFLKPIPIGRQINLEAEIAGTESGRRRVACRALLGDVIHAEADAVLVLKPARS